MAKERASCLMQPRSREKQEGAGGKKCSPTENMTPVAHFIHQGPLSKSSKHFLKVYQVSSPSETQEKLLTISHWRKNLSETQKDC